MGHGNNGVISCENCGYPIPLPSAMRRDITHLFLACPACGHVYEYKLQQYTVGRRGSRDSGGLMLRAVACECCDSSCKFPVEVHAVLPAKIDARAELARSRISWIFHGVTCPFGHPLESKRDDTL
jgi:hypothetical protein